MSLPRLNRRMRLETLERAPDGAGGFRTTWVERGAVWASLDARRGRAGAAPVARQPWRITLRAEPRPEPGERLRLGGRIFRIEAVAEADPAGRYLHCEAEEERAT